MDRVQAQVWTVGHSTHTPGEFVALLAQWGIGLVVDVRRLPRSRRHPHFSAAAMERWLRDRGVGYRHLATLGGWRHALPDSPNGGWRNASFRGYADYALGSAFGEGFDELCIVARQARTAVMCSEALWWRCHRRLIADRLCVRGWQVWHIAGDGRATAHQLSSFAVVQPDGSVVYPAAH